MNLEQAWKLLCDVCANYRGTLQEHQTLQQALQTVQVELNKKVENEKEPTDA